MLYSLASFEMTSTPIVYRLCSTALLICCFAVSGITQERGWASLPNYEIPNSIVKGLPNQFSDVETIDDLVLSCSNTTDFGAFSRHDRYYLVNASLDSVWRKHLGSDMKSAWSGKAINYGFAYSRESNEIYAGDMDAVVKLEVGLGLFLELNIAKFHKIPVAFEVSCVDSKSKVIQLTYLKRNKSIGRQTIIFTNYGKNKTLVLHQTYFKSDKKFRDRFLYAPFHTNLIDQYHSAVLQELAAFKAISERKMKKKCAACKVKLFQEVKKLETTED